MSRAASPWAEWADSSKSHREMGAAHTPTTCHPSLSSSASPRFLGARGTAAASHKKGMNPGTLRLALWGDGRRQMDSWQPLPLEKFGIPDPASLLAPREQ